MRRSIWLALRPLLLLLLPLVPLVAACSDGGDDAQIPPGFDNGTCGEMIRFTGEYVDWDESATMFCGVFGATFQARDGGGTSSTAPNGRFDLCVPNQALTLVDVTPPAQPSMCNASKGTYTLPAIAVASRRVLFAGGAWSGRGFVMGRQAVDAAKAQVFVHVDGPPREVALEAAHGPAQARNGDAWAPGASGQDVFFPDVEVGGGKTKIVASGATVPDSIPLVAGTVTSATILDR